MKIVKFAKERSWMGAVLTVTGVIISIISVFVVAKGLADRMPTSYVLTFVGIFFSGALMFAVGRIYELCTHLFNELIAMRYADNESPE